MQFLGLTGADVPSASASISEPMLRNLTLQTPVRSHRLPDGAYLHVSPTIQRH